MEEDIKDIEEILELAKEEIENNDENITATLDLQDLKSLRNLYNLYNKEKEKNKELEKYYQCERNLLDDYIHKDKIKELLEDVDKTPFINKHVKGQYLYDNLKMLLQEGENNE